MFDIENPQRKLNDTLNSIMKILDEIDEKDEEPLIIKNKIKNRFEVEENNYKNEKNNFNINSFQNNKNNCNITLSDSCQEEIFF